MRNIQSVTNVHTNPKLIEDLIRDTSECLEKGLLLRPQTVQYVKISLEEGVTERLTEILESRVATSHIGHMKSLKTRLNAFYSHLDYLLRSNEYESSYFICEVVCLIEEMLSTPVITVEHCVHIVRDMYLAYTDNYPCTDSERWSCLSNLHAILDIVEDDMYTDPKYEKLSAVMCKVCLHVFIKYLINTFIPYVALRRRRAYDDAVTFPWRYYKSSSQASYALAFEHLLLECASHHLITITEARHSHIVATNCNFANVLRASVAMLCDRLGESQVTVEEDV